jgi:hypothetical protein
MRRMARKLRIQYPGAIYHVMNRGDRQEPIFEDEQCQLQEVYEFLNAVELPIERALEFE